MGTSKEWRTSLPYSASDEIELLPALPQAWKDGSVSGLCARGGYEVSMVWKNSKVTSCTIKAKKAGTVTLLYNGLTETLELKAGENLLKVKK